MNKELEKEILKDIDVYTILSNDIVKFNEYYDKLDEEDIIKCIQKRPYIISLLKKPPTDDMILITIKEWKDIDEKQIEKLLKDRDIEFIKKLYKECPDIYSKIPFNFELFKLAYKDLDYFKIRKAVKNSNSSNLIEILDLLDDKTRNQIFSELSFPITIFGDTTINKLEEKYGKDVIKRGYSCWY